MKRTFLLSISMIFILSGCYKITEVSIMKGEWEVMEVKINGGALNQMEQLLPEFTTKGRYIIYMLEGGLMKAEYYIGDVLDYEELGEWRLESKDHLYMKIDEYIDGTFLIQKNDDHEYTMYSDSNYVSFYEIGVSTMVLELKRH